MTEECWGQAVLVACLALVLIGLQLASRRTA